VVTYTQFGGVNQEIPAAAAIYYDQHTVMARWAVRDDRHFRVDLTIVQPALLAETITYIRNGSRLLVYDHRTETASESRLRQGGPFPIDRWLLSGLKNALPLGAGAPDPDPLQSIQRYLRSLQQSGADRQPPEYARLVGHGRVLGRQADIVEFGPLQREDYITGCSFTHPGPCTHHPSGHGTGRVWVDHYYPLILRYQEIGTTNDPDVATNFQTVTTSLQYGRGPSSRALRYRPPVRVVRTGWPVLLVSGAWSASFGPSVAPPKGFLTPLPPTRFHSSLTTAAVTDLFSDGPTAETTGYHRVYSTGTMENGRVTGPYLFIQEHLQVHGLPAPLRQGAPAREGRCQVYGGRYADGQQWAAFQRGRVSVLISTNALSEEDLMRYVGQDYCRKGAR
jgi:hypothetical protein